MWSGARLAFAVLSCATIAACSSFGEEAAPASNPPSSDAGALAADASSDAGAPVGYASVVLADEPLAYWRLGEKAGSFVARDETGKHDAQYDGCTLGVPGAIEGDTAVSFAADASSIVLPVGFDFAGVAPFSIEAWIDPATSSAVFRHAFTQEWNDGKGRQGFALLIDYGAFAFERFVDGANEAKIVAPVGVRTGTFSHVVATYDGTTMRLYVDGSTMGTKPEARALPSTDAALFLGASGKHQQVVEGVMDEVAVYDKALPEARIRAHYAARAAR